MFLHKQLDFHLSRLEAQVQQDPDDAEARVELARAALSKALFHGGGEPWCNQALNHARKVLAESPGHPAALVTAGLALVGMSRPDAARKYLDEAERLDPERGDLHLAWGTLYRGEGDRHSALKHLEQACRAEPESWEAHLYLGRVLAERAREVPNQRLVERSQFHLVRALKLGPSPDVTPPLLRDIGVSCLQTGRLGEAEKLFVRLREHEKFRATARFHLGMVAYNLGKYNNAIQHFRQFLAERPDDPKVHARMAMAFLQLGQLDKAREACSQALVLDPANKLARYALGCALLEEGNSNEAIRVFKEALQENPDHAEAYLELARARRNGGETAWLHQALQAEAGHYDRLPPGTGPGTPRAVTRERITILLDQLRALGPTAAPELVRVLDMVQDEAIRFQVWETTCTIATAALAEEAAAGLREPAAHFGAKLGRQTLAASAGIPENVLSKALNLEEKDLKKAAVDRHAPTTDVAELRRNVEGERVQARTWQSLILLALATRRSRTGRKLLEGWRRASDPELAVAAEVGLAMFGDPGAVNGIRDRARQKKATDRVNALLQEVLPPRRSMPPRPVADHEDAHCAACGRTARDAAHLMAGSEAVICDVCVLQVSRKRRQLAAPDDACCSFCSRSQLESRGVYRWQGVDICSSCLELTLGLFERDEVDRFLTAW